MLIRAATQADVDVIRQLYYDTITTVNTRDYTPEQINIWASGGEDIAKWKARVAEQHFYVAEDGSTLTGFASITNEGYIDFMFTHKHHQGGGVATQLLHKLEEKAEELKLKEIWAEVSITARPFFAKHGFVITKRFVKTVKGVDFDDAVMTLLF